MNYKRIYDSIIEKSKNRILEGYVEKHHIVPRCIGGSDDKDNIAILTAREHYICHQLLVKIHPQNEKLIIAASYMCVNNKNTERMNNRLYEWLRIKHSLAMSKIQGGTNNSQYGTCWISNFNTEESKGVKKDELEYWKTKGWVKGRIQSFIRECKTCTITFKIKDSKQIYCDDKCIPKRTDKLLELMPQLIEDYKETNSIRKTLRNFNLAEGGRNIKLLSANVKPK